MSSKQHDEPGSIPIVAKEALSQKRAVSQLNTRLELLVKNYKDSSRVQNSLKQSLAKQEIDFRNRLKQSELQYTDTIEKLRKENQHLAFNNKRLEQDINTSYKGRNELEERLVSAESRSAALLSEMESLKESETKHINIINNLRKENASFKYQNDKFLQEKKSFDSAVNSYKNKYEEILRLLTQKESEAKSQSETYERMIMDKNDELDSMRKELKSLEIQNDSTQTRLRKEFDAKLAEFVEKREGQYIQEKNEWMRIFKDEFNRKMSTYKQSNAELKDNNDKYEKDVQDLRTRISKLKQIKTELEVQNRNNEEELDKIRNDFDDVRRKKDNEIKLKNTKIIELRDRYKAKELQFDELISLKLQLDAEIALYRDILNEAESNAGYMSPLAPTYKHGGNNRKRKRLNITPFGTSTKGNDDNKIQTPGLTRAAVHAKNDIQQSLRSDISALEEDDVKDKEEEEEEVDNDDDYTTPGNVEGAALQFSGLDLNNGMVEIKNLGENELDLGGYTLSNKSGNSLFPLPKNKKLKRQETLRIFVGKKLLESMDIDDDDEDDDSPPKSHLSVIGSYKGSYVFWTKDVWTGNAIDCARLYNPKNTEVARIEISPDMLEKKDNKSCIIM